MTIEILTLDAAAISPVARWALASLLVSGLAGCGGQGGDGNPATAPAALTAAYGHYTTDCGRETAGSGEYKHITATLSDGGKGRGKAEVHYQAFGQDSQCSPASLDTSIEADFLVTPLTGSKHIKGHEGHPLAAEALLAEVQLSRATYSAVTISSAEGQSFPMPGQTAKVAYLADGQSLRFVSGPREADGLGDRFSNRILKRVP